MEPQTLHTRTDPVVSQLIYSWSVCDSCGLLWPDKLCVLYLKMSEISHICGQIHQSSHVYYNCHGLCAGGQETDPICRLTEAETQTQNAALFTDRATQKLNWEILKLLTRKHREEHTTMRENATEHWGRHWPKYTDRGQRHRRGSNKLNWTTIE